MSDKQFSPKKRSTKTQGKKKSTSKKGVKKKDSIVEASVQKHIEEAADMIPNLIAHDMLQPAQSTQQSALPRQYHHHYKTQRTLLWIGVAIIGSAVCIMWLLNTTSMIAAVSKTAPQQKLIEQARADVDRLFSQVNPAEEVNLQKQLEKNFSDDKKVLQTLVQGSIAALIEQQVISTEAESPAAEPAQEATKENTTSDSPESQE